MGRAHTLLVGLVCVVAVATGQAIQALAAAAPTGSTVSQLRPRVVSFRDLPGPTSGARFTKPFHVPNPSAFATAKQAAQESKTGRRSGVRTLTASAAGGSSPAGPAAPRVGEGSKLSMTPYQGVTISNDAQAVEPPDTTLAVGTTYVVEMVNTVVAVYTKSNMIMFGGPRSLDVLFGVPSGYSSTDPRVYYDPASGTWFASAFAFDTRNDSRVYLAVATDPTATWSVYTVASNTNQTLHDQPKMAVTSDKVVITWDDYSACVSPTSCPYTGAETYVLDKANLVASPLATVGSMSLGKLAPPAEGLLPVQPLAPTSTAYVAYNESSDPTTGNPLSAPKLGLRIISGTIAGGITVVDTSLSLGSDGTTMPPNAAEPGTNDTIMTDDDRLLTGAWKNSSFWVSANDGCFPSDGSVTTSCGRFMQVATPPSGSPYLAQNFDLAAASGTSIYYPAVSLDANGNLLSVFNESSSSMYPALTAAVPFPSASASTLIQASTGFYDWHASCNGQNRWGDYSGAAPDPTTGEIWVAGEYALNAAVGSLPAACAWGTEIAHTTLTLPSTSFYFAEGYTGSGYAETLSMLIPNYNGTATIAYDIVGGIPIVKSGITLSAGQVWTENVNNDVPLGSAVSAQVVLSAPGTVERTIHFNDPAQLRFGSTDKVGAPGPSRQWNFAEGSTLAAYREYLSLQNPANTPANATLNYFLESGGTTAPVVKKLALVANSRTTVEVFGGDTSGTLTSPVTCVPGAGGSCGVGPGISGVSVQVLSDTPIVVERPFYVHGYSFGSGTIEDGHDAFGATAAAPTWYLAEGTTQANFNEFLTLQNPNPGPVSVTLNYSTDQPGVHPSKSMTLPPTSRTTVVVYEGNQNSGSCSAGEGGSCGIGRGITGVSIAVAASDNIVAERPMYMVEDFGSGPVAGAHVAVGATALSQLFGFAWASTVSGDNDYLTIQNPGSTSAQVAITYYATAGGQSRTFTTLTSVAANSRKTVLVFQSDGVGAGAGWSPLGIVVQADQGVLVEKPTYSSNSSTYGATDTLGYSPAAGF